MEARAIAKSLRTSPIRTRITIDLIRGKDVDEAKSIINDYCNMIKGEEVLNEDALEEALVYQGVAAFPARMKCATIAWKAVEELLGEEDE